MGNKLSRFLQYWVIAVFPYQRGSKHAKSGPKSDVVHPFEFTAQGTRAEKMETSEGHCQYEN